MYIIHAKIIVATKITGAILNYGELCCVRVFVPKNKTESKRVANRFRGKTESRDQSCHPNKIQMGDKNPEGLDIYIPGYVFACLLNSSAKSNNFRVGN